MSSKYIVKKWLELSGKFGAQTNEMQPVEFFFYSISENSASDIAIDLHSLGYEVYDIKQIEDKRWSIVGVTLPLRIEEEHFSQWADMMHGIADSHEAVFDGWGMLINKPD